MIQGDIALDSQKRLSRQDCDHLANGRVHESDHEAFWEDAAIFALKKGYVDYNDELTGRLFNI